MRDKDGFDLWAKTYEKDVVHIENRQTYPFAGYGEVLDLVARIVLDGGGGDVLDLGFGTGKLTQALYHQGCRVSGIDFSEEMCAIAKQRMPEAQLFCCDFSEGLPEVLRDIQFDFIISTYAFHHIPDAHKAAFLAYLQTHLKAHGEIVIGDVAFETEKQKKACREGNREVWDEREEYSVYSALKQELPRLCFQKISFCSGVFTLRAAR